MLQIKQLLWSELVYYDYEEEVDEKLSHAEDTPSQLEETGIQPKEVMSHHDADFENTALCSCACFGSSSSKSLESRGSSKSDKKSTTSTQVCHVPEFPMPFMLWEPRHLYAHKS